MNDLRDNRKDDANLHEESRHVHMAHISEIASFSSGDEVEDLLGGKNYKPMKDFAFFASASRNHRGDE